MVKKGKPMPIGLQRYVISKIILKRGNTRSRKTVEGKYDNDNVIPDGDSSALDADAILDNLGPEAHLDGNISNLESGGFLLPVLGEEMFDYETKQVLQEQEKLEEGEKQKQSWIWRLGIVNMVLVVIKTRKNLKL